MRIKFRFFKTGFFVSLLLLFLCSEQVFAANVLGRPRKMFMIATEHFDFIFSKESYETATHLAGKADFIYKKAKDAFGSELNLHMPVIISPDSDVLSVDYTPHPYNRIIIFDSAADYDTAVFEDVLCSLFYREVYKALAQSSRSSFNQFVSDWLAGETYQPVALFNLPYSFIEGAAYLAEASDENGQEGRLNDGYFLQILSQAKLEGKFPNWMQVSTVRDSFPGEELALAAGAGFSAFLMNVYGVQKYSQLWKESGSINPLLTQGVFSKVYEKSLSELWQEFEQSVQVPQNLAESELVFPGDSEANYEHILVTDYGIVWYDRLRHEVDIYDENSFFKIRQLLFLADNVSRMSLSPNGRYIAVSHTQGRTMEDLSSCSTWIYDLKERRFLKAKYPLRDSTIVCDKNGDFVVAGVNVKKSRPRLQVYSMPQTRKTKLIFEKTFKPNQIPFSPVYAGNGFLTYILAKGTSHYLCKCGFSGHNDSEKKWLITSGSAKTSAFAPLQIQRLAFCRGNAKTGPLYTFTFALPHENCFTRAGFVFLDGNLEPVRVALSSKDFSGGMNFPTVSRKGELFYSAKTFKVNELRKVGLGAVDLVPGALCVADAFEAPASPEAQTHVFSQIPVFSDSQLKIKRYNPFKYIADVSFTPFFPIKLIDLSDGIFYWPGLGITIESQTDPCMNTKMLFSAGWTYLPLDFSWTKNIPSNYLATIRSESLNLKKDKSFAYYIENSSTPLYLKAGTVFDFNLQGEYYFKSVIGGQWKLPIGIALRNLLFDFQASYEVSTDYYDQTQSAIRPSLKNWPKFTQAYGICELSWKLEYSNIHQYGYSTFEQRGLSLGIRAYSMWDMYEVHLLKNARNDSEAQDQADETSQLTNAQKKNLFDNNLAEITQLNAGFYASVAIPRLTPFTSENGWILSVPAKISAEFMNKAGTALDAKYQILLLGREIHNGFASALFYCRRAGLWFGYDMSLVYDTTEVRLPDLRHKNYLAEIFKDVSYTHAIYAVLNLDVNILAGKLSSVPINTTLTGFYFPQSNGYDISLDIRLHL